MSGAPAGQAWASNATGAQVVARLRAAKRVVIVTHSKPDGDAAGSVLAMVRSIAQAAGGGSAEAWLVGPQPHWLGHVVGPTPVRLFKGGESPAQHDGDADAVLIVDTGSWSQLRELAGWIRARHDRAIVIDHHLHGDADVAAVRLIETDAPATAQIAAGLCCELLGVPSPSRLPADVAEPLYLGLATDTGWFRHENVTARALRLAADLLEAGASHTRLFQAIEQQDTPARLRLMGRALASAELHRADSVAIMTLLRKDFTECGADRNDSTGFVEIPLTIGSVAMSAVVTEEAADQHGAVTKISLRSKPGPRAVDVNAVSGRLGGGGHARAAGARVAMGVDDAKRALLAALDAGRA